MSADVRHLCPCACHTTTTRHRAPNEPGCCPHARRADPRPPVSFDTLMARADAAVKAAEEEAAKRARLRVIRP